MVRDPMQELAEQHIAELRVDATLRRYAAERRTKRRALVRAAVGQVLVRVGERLQAPRPPRSAVSS